MSATLYRAPGRVNLIGEHTDYNDGFVMPVAIDRATTATMTPRADRQIVARSGRRSAAHAIDMDDARPARDGNWIEYIRGVAAMLERRAHRLTGADNAITSDVPTGAALGSSAALEVAAGFGLLDLAGRDIDLDELARACQQAEHEFVGTRCGVMDQFIACHGRPGHALMLDTRTLESEWLPIPDGVRILVCNSMTKHVHATSGYNERRADCEAGARALAAALPDIRALRDVALTDLELQRSVLPDRVYRRCRHVITENARVLEAADALSRGDLDVFGSLMVASHDSLRDDFEVTTPALDALVEAALACEGVYGARMTGGGFGGCAIALVDAPYATAVAEEVQQRYHDATGFTTDIYPCTPSGGVCRVA
jgi:galactokinase